MPRDKRRWQAWAQAAGSEGESADNVPRPAAVEGDRARAADGTAQDKEPRKGKGTGRARRGASRAPRQAATERMELSEARSLSVGAAKGTDTGLGRIQAPARQARAQVTGGRTRSADRGTRAWRQKGTQGQGQRCRWPSGTDRTGHRSRRGRAERKEGDGGPGAPIAGRAASAVHPPRHPTNAGAPHPPPPSPPPRPPLQHRPRRLRSHPPPTPQTSAPASPPHAEGGAGSDGRSLGGGGGRDAAPAPQAHGPQGGLARGAEGGRPWYRDWDTVPDPQRGEALPLVTEVYGWLSWACSGTTRGMRNRPFDAVLLRRDGKNRVVPLGGWAAPKDHERVLQTVFQAGWPKREPTCPAYLEGGAVLRIMDADANNWLPRALRNALTNWRYRRRNPPPPQPEPPHKRRRQ